MLQLSLSRQGFPLPLKKMMNHNVLIALLLTGLGSISDGMLLTVVFPAFIFLITNRSNTRVGESEALQGCAEALSAIPIGLALDLLPIQRQTVLRAGATVGVIACFVTVYAVVKEDFGLVCVALAITGVWNATCSGPVETILADSLETGNRSTIYTTRTIIATLTRVLGHVINLILFLRLGDEWSASECRSVIFVGLGFALICALLQYLFLDRHMLGHESEGLLHDTASRGPVTPSYDGSNPSGPSNGANLATFPPSGSPSESQGSPLLASLPGPSWYCITPACVPYIVTLSDLIFGVGSGMTIKFFALFFQNEVKLSPAQVTSITIVTPLAIAICASALQRVSLIVGRIPAVLFACVSGVGLLFVMVLLPNLWTQPRLIIPIYVLRTAFINCPNALVQSVMMDFVPKSHRGRWTSLGSITSFGWSGSAALGGYLVDKHGYGVSFGVTAVMQAVATLVLVSLWPLVPPERAATGAEDTEKEKVRWEPDTLVVEQSNSGGGIAPTTNTAAAGTSTDEKQPLL